MRGPPYARRLRACHVRRHADLCPMLRWLSATGILRVGLAACLLVVRPTPLARATTLLAPAAGARDAAMTGSTVAAPSDAMSAFFLNPAGLTLLERSVATFGAGFMLVSTGVRTPFGYDEESSSVALAPSFGVAMRCGNGWAFGVGTFGSVGSKFDFPADPAHGVPRGFFSELGAVTIAPTLAYQLRDDLALGLQINPILGTLENHVPTPEQSLRWRVTGPGIQGVVALLYSLSPGWRLGLTYKTPGKIYMDGSVRIAGDRQHLSFDLDLPQQVILGVAWEPIPTLLLTLFGRWSDTSKFEDSMFRFADTPALDFPFARAATDEYRVGGGAEYRVHERVALRIGLAAGTAAIEASSVSPLLYDLNDVILGGGFGLDFGRWVVDLQAGTSFFPDRVVNAKEALVFPGRYSAGGPVTFAQVTRRF
jgi:long-subunit fatty acid transport protein